MKELIQQLNNHEDRLGKLEVLESGSTTDNIYLASGKDIFPDGDIYGLWDRFINWGILPDEHWHQNADDISWVGYATYTGFTSTIGSSSTDHSSLKISVNPAASTFRYRASSNGADIYLRARCGLTYLSTSGIMIDDGTSNADGKGANNFYRTYITQSALGGAVTAVEEFRTGGGAVSTNVGPTMPYGRPVGLKIAAIATTRWTNWLAQCSTIDELGEVRFTGGTGSMSWTPARVGLYAKHTGGDFGRKAVWDWYDEATS